LISENQKTCQTADGVTAPSRCRGREFRHQGKA